MNDLATVRRDLAEARAEPRQREDYYHSRRLHAEFALLDKAGDPKNVGSNEADRKRAYEIACEGDDDCRHALASLRTQQLAVARLEAELEILRDAFKERDLAVRERYVDAVPDALAALSQS